MKSAGRLLEEIFVPTSVLFIVPSLIFVVIRCALNLKYTTHNILWEVVNLLRTDYLAAL